MNESSLYIHIGLPKCYSTSLQKLLANLYFNGCLDYYGFIPSNNHDEWYNENIISKFLNYDLRVTNRSNFISRKKSYIDYFKDAFSSNEMTKWLSSENLSTRFTTSEITPEEKIERLDIFSNHQIRYIVFLRPLREVLPSIYKEYVKQGYTQSFTYFLNESIALEDINYIKSYFPGHLKQLLIKYSPKSRIKFFYTGFDLKEGGEFIQYLTKTLKNYSSISQLLFPYENNSEPRATALRDNIKYNRTLFGHIDATGMLETHRILFHSDKWDDIKWNKLRRQYKFNKFEKEFDASGRHQEEDFKMLNSTIEVLRKKYLDIDMELFNQPSTFCDTRYLDYWGVGV